MTKPVLLLLHGALGSPDQMQPLADALADRFTVYCPAFRGHGGNVYEDHFHMEDFSEDIKIFMDSRGIQKAHLFGYSMGGYAGVWMAKQNPDRIGHLLTYGTKWDWNPETAAKESSMLIPEVMEEKIPGYVGVLKARFHPADWKASVRKTADMLTTLGQAPLLTRETCAEIPHPLCITVGSKDLMASPEVSRGVSTWFPNARFVEWEGWPHPIEKVDVEALAVLVKEKF